MPLFQTASSIAAEYIPDAPLMPAGLGGDDILLASQALAPQGEVNVPGMIRPFLPHQAAAYQYALASIERWGGTILGHDMGVGKTQMMLALALTLAKGSYAILVGPPIALGTYRDEIAKVAPSLRLVPLPGITRKPHEEGDIYFLSDDARVLGAWLTDGVDEATKQLIPSALARGAAIYIRDEVHRDKGNDGKPTARAKVGLAVAKYMHSVRRPVIIATGTLLTNRPVEAFLPLQMVSGPDLVKAVTPGAKGMSGYLWRYCNPVKSRFGTSFAGVNNAEMKNLHEYLRRTVYTRIERDDLGDMLPHHGYVITPLALNGKMARYDRVANDLLTLLLEEEGREAAERADRALPIVQMQKLWEEAGVAKAEAAAEYMADLVEQGHKVLGFYTHNRVFDAMLDKLLKLKVEVVAIHGGVSKGARDRAIDALQNGSAQVMLINTKSAGVSLTLTAAAHAVFVQVPWSAGDFAQAAARIKRTDEISIERAKRGEQVTYHVLQAAYEDGTPSFDMAMWDILEGKAEVCDAVNAGREITMPEESIMRQVLQAWFPGAADRQRRRDEVLRNLK